MQVIYSVFLFWLFVAINIGLAKIDAYKIKRHLRIRHAVNAVVYLAIMGIFYKFFTVYKVFGILLVRIPVFNTALNVFRGLPADHISHTTTSIIDQCTNSIVQKIGYYTYHVILFVLSFILVLN
jgi:hypothetical protein